MNTIDNTVKTFIISTLILFSVVMLYISFWVCLPPYLLSQLNNLIGLNKLLIFILLLFGVLFVFIQNNKIVILGKSMLLVIIAILTLYVIRAIIEGSASLPPVFELIFSVVYGILIYLLLTNIFLKYPTPKISSWIHVLIIVSTLISAFVGIYQMLPNMGKDMPELPGLFYVKNHFGIFVSIGFALSATRYFLSKGFIKILWLIISFILLLGLILSFSRAAWLSSIIILYLLAIYFNKKYLLILPTFLFIIILYIFWERIFDVAYLGDISTGRFLLWSTFLSHLFTYGNLFFGLGIGYTFKFNPKELVGFVGFQAADNPYIYVHNDFLYFFLETGMIGLLLFIYFYVIIIRDINKFLRNEKNNLDEIKIILSVKCSLIPIIIMHFTDTFLFASGLLYYLFFLLSSSYRILDKRKILECP